MPNTSIEAHNKLKQIYNQLLMDIQSAVNRLQELSYNNHIYTTIPDNHDVDEYTMALVLFYDKLPYTMDDELNNISPINQFPRTNELNKFIYHYRNMFSIDINCYKKSIWHILLEINKNKILNSTILSMLQQVSKTHAEYPTILKVKDRDCGVFTINMPSNNIVSDSKKPYEEMLEISNRVKTIKHFISNKNSRVDKLDLKLCQLIADNVI